MSPAADDGWRRLDRRMLLIHPLQSLLRTLPALAAILLARSGAEDPDRWELLLLPLVVAWGMARWFTTRFRIAQGQIELRRGLVSRQSTTARLDRVRTVDLTAAPHHRVLGLARVEIATAGSAGGTLVLDSLGIDAARRLRAELLHRAGPQVSWVGGADPALPPPAPGALPSADLPPPPAEPASAEPAPAEPASAPATATTTAAAAEGDEVLLRLDPRWVRYAPFTATGLVAAFAIVGFLGQGTRSFVDDDAVASWATWLLTRAAWWVDVVGVLVLVCVLGTGGYLLSFWDFRLSRNRLGSLHVRRGLLTSRETSIDRNRLRGVRIGEPLGLRLAGARRLRAVSTGLSERSEGSASDWLAPPSPAAVVTELAAEVTGDRAAVGAPLEAHGPVARQRRMTRALVPTALAAVAVAGADLRFDGPLPLPVLTAVVAAVLVGAAFLGRDRYAGLGHAVTPRHIVVRSGSIARDRVVLDRAGIVGWTVRQSFFQRRAGVVTLIATTAAGQQHYDLVDLTPERAYEVVGIVSPALLAELA